MGDGNAGATALSVLSDTEKATVLDELIADDLRVRAAAEDAARLWLAHVDAWEVAHAVAAALIELGQDELAAHAGRTRYGYVEPTEAAWTLLEQAVEPWIEDIARRAKLGLAEAARQLALGALGGLYRVQERTGDDGLLVSWAPDFPGEAADRVLRALDDVGLELSEAEVARVGPDWA